MWHAAIKKKKKIDTSFCVHVLFKKKKEKENLNEDAQKSGK